VAHRSHHHSPTGGDPGDRSIARKAGIAPVAGVEDAASVIFRPARLAGGETSVVSVAVVADGTVVAKVVRAAGFAGTAACRAEGRLVHVPVRELADIAVGADPVLVAGNLVLVVYDRQTFGVGELSMRMRVVDCTFEVTIALPVIAADSAFVSTGLAFVVGTADLTVLARGIAVLAAG